MGNGVLQFPIAPPNCCSHEFLNTRNNSTNFISTSTSWCCFATTKHAGRTGGSDWERTSGGYRQSKYQDEFFTCGYDDEEEEVGFRNAEKKRTWWSDDSLSWGEYDDDEEEQNFGGFGILEGAVGFSSIYKVFRAFGWMVPAVIISMLIGTGTNGFLMALALPLAQSALSLIFDTLWGGSSYKARPKSRKWKGSFTGKADNIGTRKERKQNTQSDRKSDGYRTWEAANNFTAKKGERRTQNFGGWDELDRERRTEEEPKPSTTAERRQQTEGKLSKRARNRQRSLFVRLLIAFFPFLGSWTRFL